MKTKSGKWPAGILLFLFFVVALWATLPTKEFLILLLGTIGSIVILSFWNYKIPTWLDRSLVGLLLIGAPAAVLLFALFAVAWSFIG